MSEGSGEAILFCELAVTDVFLPWTWNWYKPPETCKLNAQFRSECSNRKNEPAFLDFPLFLGIFQWDKPTKRFPFNAEPRGGLRPA